MLELIEEQISKGKINLKFMGIKRQKGNLYYFLHTG